MSDNTGDSGSDGSGWKRERAAERMKWQSGRDKNKNGHKVLLMNDAGEKKRKGEQVRNSKMELFGTKYDFVPKIAVALLLNLFEFK